VDSNDLGKHHEPIGRLTIKTLGLKYFGDLAFKRRQRLLHPRWPDKAGRLWGEAGIFELRNAAWRINRGRVHLLRQIARNQVGDKLARLFRPSHAVLGAFGGEHYQMRMRAERVEE